MRHLKPRIVTLRRTKLVTIVADPHGKPPRSAIISIVKILVWLVEEWYASFFQDTKETLLVYDRYYHDLLVDPMRYRYGAPLWVAKLVSKLMPQPELWVLLDAPAEVLQSRKQEVTAQETARQRAAYIDLVKRQRCHVIVDASQPLHSVIADVENIVMDAISKSRGNRE
jgi:thymidylate kinase